MHLLDKIEADRNSWTTVIFIFLFGIYAEKLTEIFLVQSRNLAVILLADILSATFSAAAGYVAAIVLFVGAVICIFMGIMGYYIGKIHTQVKERPIFIAKEILTYEHAQESDN